MKFILCALVLSLASGVVNATPGKQKRNPSRVDADMDQRFVCKNDQLNYTYVVNITDGEIDTFVNDHEIANGVQAPIKQNKDLQVEKKIEYVDSSNKQIISYMISKKIYTVKRGDILRPIAEIEVESRKESSKVAYADMKLMDVKPTDVNDIDDNITCKGLRK